MRCTLTIKAIIIEFFCLDSRLRLGRPLCGFYFQYVFCRSYNKNYITYQYIPMTPTLEQITDKLELTELANKLFMYCDGRQWQQLLDEVFTREIFFDMTSAGGGEAAVLPAHQVCDMWRIGFAGLDAVHHQAGHYIITVENDEGIIFGYAVATHYRKASTQGKSRSFTGSYDLKAERTPNGWRLSQFKYNLKFVDGNISLE